MNIVELDILNTLMTETFVSQRRLARACGHSLGMVNRSVRALMRAGYLTSTVELTPKAQEQMIAREPRNAIVLAAGVGMRMAPVNLMQPKGMIEVHGEPLVERLVRQLHEAGITRITVVVGFMKEQFEYLIDEFGVELVVNRAYAARNNLHSLALVADKISNAYIVPSDIWCKHNPFRASEPYSWYMVSNVADDESFVRVTRQGELATVRGGAGGNRMVGIAYLLEEDAACLRESLVRMDASPLHAGDFWEEAAFVESGLTFAARSVPAAEVLEIDTYEQLRSLHEGTDRLSEDALAAITATLGVPAGDVRDVTLLKNGAVNRSFRFAAGGATYIMRVPSASTGGLIDRAREAAAYRAIAGRGLCDDPVLVDPANGYKITRYVEGTRPCDPHNEADLVRCMAKLREFHAMGLEVAHTFDLFERIDYYESLWGGAGSAYRDYARTKANVLSLRSFVESVPRAWCLAHIDPVADNFLFCPAPNGNGEDLQLTDWEYAGMQDPHVDIAMFAIYSGYRKAEVDRLISIYFASEGGCDTATRAKIYCYVALSGLLWSNWCEHARNLGVEFGEYSLAQYRYAKDYYRYATELIATTDVRSKSA